MYCVIFKIMCRLSHAYLNIKWDGFDDHTFVYIYENHVFYCWITISMVTQQIISTSYKNYNKSIGCPCLLEWKNMDCVQMALYCFRMHVRVCVWGPPMVPQSMLMYFKPHVYTNSMRFGMHCIGCAVGYSMVVFLGRMLVDVAKNVFE